MGDTDLVSRKNQLSDTDACRDICVYLQREIEKQQERQREKAITRETERATERPS